MKNIILAIDSTSIVDTGGFTHLYHLIENFKKENHPEIKKIIIYSSKKVNKQFIDKHDIDEVIISIQNIKPNILLEITGR